MKQEMLCESTLHYPTGSKLLTYDHNPDLNSSILRLVQGHSATY